MAGRWAGSCEVGVHDNDQLRPRGRRVPETCQVCLAKPLLARSMQDLELRHRLRKTLGQLARAIRGGVVDHQQPPIPGSDPLDLLGGRANQGLEVHGLVISWDEHPEAG